MENYTEFCSNCGTPVEANQSFCAACGAPRVVAPKKVCESCGMELTETQEFCGRCGAKVGVQISAPSTDAINQYNAAIPKKKKSIVLPIILAIVLLVAAIGGVLVYTNIQEQNRIEAIAEYKENAYNFYYEVLSTGATMEDIGNEIKTSWSAYVTSSRYNGVKYSSVDSAVAAAQSYMSSEISTVKSNDYTIESLYDSLRDVPDSSDYTLREIKELVEEVYDAYKEMYSCIISPSGNYTSWTSEFKSVDTELANVVGDLGDLVK